MKLKRLIVPLIIVLMIIFGSRYLKEKSYEYNVNPHIDKSGLYHNMAWGTSRDEVKKIFENDIKIKPRSNHEGDLMIRARYYDSMKGVNANILAFFDENNGLDGVGVYIYENEGSGYDIETLKDKYKKKLDEVYGSTSTEFDGHVYEWQTINGAVFLKVWDDEDKYNSVGIFYSNEYLHNTKGDKKGFFNSTAWGTSKEKYKERMEDKYGTYLNEGDDVIDTDIKDYMNLKGIDANITAYFVDDGLLGVLCSFTIKKDAYYSLDELKTIYMTKFNCLFSEAKYDDGKQYIWETSTGTVSLDIDENATDGEPSMIISFYRK